MTKQNSERHFIPYIQAEIDFSCKFSLERDVSIKVRAHKPDSGLIDLKCK